MLSNGPRSALAQSIPHQFRSQTSAASGVASTSSLLKATSTQVPKEKRFDEQGTTTRKQWKDVNLETTSSSWSTSKGPIPPGYWKNNPPRKDSKGTERKPIVGQRWRDTLSEGGQQLKQANAKPQRSRKAHFPHWKDSLSKKGQESQLRDLIQTASQSFRQSQESQAFFAEELDSSTTADEELGLGRVDAPIGSFVVTRRNDISSYGIVLGYQYKIGSRHLAVLTVSGQIWLPFPFDVTFIIPSYISANLAERCGKFGTVPTDAEMNARIQVLKTLRELVQELEVKRNTTCRFAQDAYPELRSSDPDAWSEVTVAEAARLVESKPRYPTIYSTHRHLMDNPLYFVARDPFLITQVFDVRPQSEVDLITKVLDWKRRGDPRLVGFAERAKLIIARNAKRLQESAVEPPSEEVASPVWNSDDQVIIRFLMGSIRQTRSNQTDPYLIARVAILRLLDPSNPFLEDKDVFKALMDMGIFAPWQDITVIQKHLEVETESNVISPRIAKREECVRESLVSRPIFKNAPLGPNDFYPSDPLEVVRHDFGQLPVFVIDSENAKELDDGISVERIPAEPGSHWVHAHISNPTATLPPSHTLAIDAMKRATSQYFLHHHIPLFPESLMHHPSTGWSLGSQKGKPARVLTFSAKLDGSGAIVDYKVRAGLVNNIHILSYNAVNELLGFDRSQLGLESRPFGGPFPEAVTTDARTAVQSLLEPEKEDIRLLEKIRGTLSQWWLDHHSLRFCSLSASVGLCNLPPGSMTPTLQYRKFQGFPEFSHYTVSPTHAVDRGAQGIVGEIMKIAGRVGSKFALDHDLPMIRRNAEGPIFISREHQEAAMTKRGELGYMYPHQAAEYVTGASAAEYSLEPRGHFFVGALEGEGYARLTSPLRRSLDLVSHWQLHRALLGRHADSSTAKFGLDWMDQYRVPFAVAERVRNRASQYHELYWQGMFIDKWLKGELRGAGFAPSDPDAVYEAYLLDEGQRSLKGLVVYQALVPALGVTGQAEGLKQGQRPNALVKVRLKDVRFAVKTGFDFEVVA